MFHLTLLKLLPGFKGNYGTQFHPIYFLSLSPQIRILAKSRLISQSGMWIADLFRTLKMLSNVCTIAMQFAQVIFCCTLPPALTITSEGTEHTMERGKANAQPSGCTLGLFHTPMSTESAPPGPGYVSNDGHHFACENPGRLQAAFHV